MDPAIKSLVAEVLKGKHFKLAVDLGCGEGYYGPFLKKYVDYLIGVDHNFGRVSVAVEFAGYDEGYFMDIRDYVMPEGVEAVFLFDSLEHIPKADGLKLLQKIENTPFILITTPVKFHTFALRNMHLSLWTIDDFQKLGYKTTIFRRIFFGSQGIMAVKEKL